MAGLLGGGGGGNNNNGGGGLLGGWIPLIVHVERLQLINFQTSEHCRRYNKGSSHRRRCNITASQDSWRSDWRSTHRKSSYTSQHQRYTSWFEQRRSDQEDNNSRLRHKSRKEHWRKRSRSKRRWRRKREWLRLRSNSLSLRPQNSKWMIEERQDYCTITWDGIFCWFGAMQDGLW